MKKLKSIENRLSAVEKAAAKTELVNVRFKDSEREESEMDLLKAVRLLLSGDVHTITARWKPGEKERYASVAIREIEAIVESYADENK